MNLDVSEDYPVGCEIEWDHPVCHDDGSVEYVSLTGIVDDHIDEIDYLVVRDWWPDADDADTIRVPKSKVEQVIG